MRPSASGRRHAAVAVTIVTLLGASMLVSYRSGHATMYVNPIYRWRESMAIALSRLQSPPLGGYVAYRSIRNHLTQNGLGLMDGEAGRLPTPQELSALILDRRRMETLLNEARRVPIDHGLPHVALAGSEKGLADYYYWAFRLFGVNLRALVLFYYLILAVSLLLFVVTFRKSPFAMLLVMLYLVGHVYMVNYANSPLIVTVHNSRFFPVLAVLPAMHLLLLLVRGDPPTPRTVAVAAAQVVIYGFLVFCRLEAVWEGLAIVACACVVAGQRSLWTALRRREPAMPAFRGAMVAAWPGILVATGLLGVGVYSEAALDRRYYRTETRTHAFWHPLFAGTVGASPALSKIFMEDPRDYTDNVVYFAVLADLRARDEVPPEIAYRQDGTIHIDAMKNMGVFDRLARRVFLDLVRDHPWLVVKSFLYDKPRDQIVMLYRARAVSVRQRWLLIAPLTLVALLVAIQAGVSCPGRREIGRALPALLVVAAFSWMPTLIVPSALIVNTILFHLLLLLLAVACLSLGAWGRVRGSGRTPATA